MNEGHNAHATLEVPVGAFIKRTTHNYFQQEEVQTCSATVSVDNDSRRAVRSNILTAITLGGATSNLNNPVWDVYDELRTARLNIKYLQTTIRRLNSWNTFFEILIAVTTSSTVAGFSFWKTAYGGGIWTAVGVVAAISSVIKPILKFPERIGRKEELLASYHILDHDLNTICIEIKHEKKYDDGLYKQFLRALDRKAELVKQDAASGVDERLRIRCREAVEQELPADSFYIPPDA